MLRARCFYIIISPPTPANSHFAYSIHILSVFAAYTWELRYREQLAENERLRQNADNLRLELEDTKTLFGSARGEMHKIRMINLELEQELDMVVKERDELQDQCVSLQQKLHKRDKDVEALMAQVNLLIQVSTMKKRSKEQKKQQQKRGSGVMVAMVPEDREVSAVRMEGMKMLETTNSEQKEDCSTSNKSDSKSESTTDSRRRIQEHLFKLRDQASNMFVGTLAHEEIDPSTVRKPTFLRSAASDISHEQQQQNNTRPVFADQERSSSWSGGLFHQMSMFG